MLSYFIALRIVIVLFVGQNRTSKTVSFDNKQNNPVQDTAATLKSYITGDTADITTPTVGGLLLMGGSTDVDSAIAWFLKRSGGGDIVVIRSSGADGYNDYMYKMYPVNSVETVIINSREKAFLPIVEQKIKNAEALFIAGGDQWNYVNYWKNSPIEDAINYLINKKHVTVGGTSAGCAVLGGTYFNAQNGTVTSQEALNNPYNEKVTLGHNDFISAPNMQNTITDSHYTQRDRQGRHITFLAKMLQDLGSKKAKGIGVDEKTAVCIDEKGIGKVYGVNNAYFLQNTKKGAEIFQKQTPLTWEREKRAIKAYKIAGSSTGNGSFNANTWAFSGGISYYYYVNNGVLTQN